jgi:hypothetical protein
MIMVQAAGFSDIGKVRKANEDCFLLNEPIGLFVVADGMGGHRGGGIASRMAIETIDAYMATPSQEPSIRQDRYTVDAASPAANVFVKAYFWPIKRSTRSPSRTRPAGEWVPLFLRSTLSAILSSPPMLETAPFTLLRNGEIETLYTPHTLLHEREKIPKSLKGKFSIGKLAHILTRAVGIRSDVGVDLVETPCLLRRYRRPVQRRPQWQDFQGRDPRPGLPE